MVKNQSVDHSQFNIVSPQFKANPFPLVANLRASQPVFRTALPDKTSVWLLTRYEDVATLLKDECFVFESCAPAHHLRFVSPIALSTSLGAINYSAPFIFIFVAKL